MTIALHDILNRLMFEKRIRTAELARKTNLPQATLSRIVSGITPNPHFSTLKTLADYFNINIEQLKGLQPIPWLLPQSVHETGWYKVPLLTWEQAIHWEKDRNQSLVINDEIFTDAHCNSKCFALKIKDSSMEPQFPKETIIIIDPTKEAKDRSYIVAQIANHAEVIFRQLLIDGPYKYLKPISPDFERFKLKLMNTEDQVIGVLIQARCDYNV